MCLGQNISSSYTLCIGYVCPQLHRVPGGSELSTVLLVSMTMHLVASEETQVTCGAGARQCCGRTVSCRTTQLLHEHLRPSLALQPGFLSSHLFRKLLEILQLWMQQGPGGCG